MNEAFDGMINMQTINRGMKEGKELSYFNLIDVGVITSVAGNRCSVQSYRMLDGRNVVYSGLELVYPGGTGSFNPDGMTCVVLFPKEVTCLKDRTIATLKPYFSAFGGKVIPITTEGDCAVKAGPSFDKAYYFSSDYVTVRIADDSFSLSVKDNLSLYIDAANITASIYNGNIIMTYDVLTNTSRKTQLNSGTPFYYEYMSPTEHWIGHVGYKAITHNDIKNDISKYQKTDFLFTEYFISTERWIYVYKDDGSTYCAIGLDNTGVIDLTTEESVTVTTKKDVTVNRDGTKLEVKNGKVVVTGDLEVSGKTTITGMKTDVQNFFDGLTSALNSMFTIGSPATHQTDGGFKSNIAILRAKL